MGIAGVILSLLEIPKGKAALKIATYNKKIEELKSGKENHVQQIGFAIGDELQEIEEEEEDDDEY